MGTFWCWLGGGARNFGGNFRVRFPKQSFEIPTPNLVLHFLRHILAPQNQFFAFFSKKTNFGGKCQEIKIVPWKISYNLMYMKLSLCRTISLKTLYKIVKISKFLVFHRYLAKYAFLKKMWRMKSCSLWNFLPENVLST